MGKESELTTGVRDFHVAFGVPQSRVPMVPATERLRLRLRLIAEEFCELLDASGCAATDLLYLHLSDMISGACQENADLVEIADALGDIEYVCTGMALECGIDLDAVIREIQRSNIAKVGGPMRADGKIGKPPGWTAPDIAGVLYNERSVSDAAMVGALALHQGTLTKLAMGGD